MKVKSLLILLILASIHFTEAQDDKYQWLEDVDSDRSLNYVNNLSQKTFEQLSAQKEYQSIYNQSLKIYNSSDKIAYPSIKGNYVYNFWKDNDHVRGIWRRCPLEDYVNQEFEWETLLDIDQLSKEDGIKWVFKGSSGLYPSYNRFLIELSKGGGDAVITKEFDIETKQFLDDGFFIEESKGGAAYLDQNSLIVSSDFGEGTMTTSGYPRQVKIWKRGTPIEDARLVYEGEADDVGTWGGTLQDGPKIYTFITRAITFFNTKSLVWQNGEIIQLDIPDDSRISGILNNQLIVRLKSDWLVNSNNYKSGSLISLNFAELLKGSKQIKVIHVPDEFSSISEIATTKNKLLVNILSNVTGKLFVYSYDNDDWNSQKVKAPDLGSISIISSSDLTDQYFFNFENFLTPSTLFYADAGNNTFQAHKSLPEYFDGSKYEVKQFKAESKDGTMIPYFMVSNKDLKMNSENHTLIYAYGGFEVSQSPFYAATWGVSWLENGGVLVLANIRGGGEFGPSWHQEGLKEKRQNVFDDLYAVSEDLISKKVTSPKHLGVMGGSNGGLLVGVALTQRPELYNAIVCQVPLLDMKRYNKLLAGASWMSEYGNPDIPEEWEYIKKYSPYHNLKENMDYPEAFFYTSTRDDRVHPGHARKMVAKMNDMGYKTYYYENTEGGHAGSSTNEQRAKSSAMSFSYLLMKLK